MLTIDLLTSSVSRKVSLLSEILTPTWPEASQSPRSLPLPRVPHALTQVLLVPTVILNFLFSYWLSHRLTQDGSRAQQMALHTLKMMANGGIRDHVGQVRGIWHSLGGQQEAVGWGQRPGLASSPMSCLAQGFHRYSTDRQWHIPHFEKMLYDQAQLAVAYTQAFQVTPEPGPGQGYLACPPTSGCPPRDFPGDLGLPLNFTPDSLPCAQAPSPPSWENVDCPLCTQAIPETSVYSLLPPASDLRGRVLL